MTFSGAKLALFLGDQIVSIQRDDKQSIPYPAHWDFPGGGREGNETPADCVIRETQEELGLIVEPADLIWSKRYETTGAPVWFFAVHLPASRVSDIRFGDEGQRWALMSPAQYCTLANAIPHLAQRLAEYMESGDFPERPPAKASGGR